MDYALRYSFENIDNDIYVYNLIVKSKTSFILCGCKVQFINGEYKYIDILSLINYDGNNFEEVYLAQIDVENCAKLLSYIFMAPIYDRKYYNVIATEIIVNDALSKRNMSVIQYIDKCVNKFKKTKEFFYEILELYVIALENQFGERMEDAFFYYFKIIEKISKRYYYIYMKRHHTKNANKDKKMVLKNIIKKYAKNKLSVVVTDEMLNTKIDLIYNNLKKEFYGSVFNKISLFITKEEIHVDLKVVDKLVKTRHKLAHGDSVPFSELNLSAVINLTNEMISKNFFRKEYKEIKINVIEIKVDN